MFKDLLRKIQFLYQSTMKKGFCEYHSFPFDTLLPLPKGADLVMIKGCELIEDCNINYRLTDGTVLGLYREKKFIAHDNDIDIDVFNCDENKIQKLIALFKSKGFIVGRVAKFNKKTHQVIFYDRNNTLFDILFWYKDNDEFHNYSEKGYVRTQNLKYFTSLSSIHMSGKDFPAPGYLEEWLVVRYGEGWKTPKIYKGDWKDDCFDLQKLGEVK
jgi:phosphorylcholine metabolism protein LicD